MNYYLAPLEGITGYIYRNAYHQHFYQMDKYFTPFLTPNQNKRFRSGEINDVLPEHNQGLLVVPQLLTNNAEHFLWAAKELAQFGYQEINLNLGCPSKTVVTKGKGSGFLDRPFALEQFLDQIFLAADIRISIKTRLAKDDPEDFYDLLELFNKYPLSELIVHPRVQTDYYKNQPNYEMFGHAVETSKNPLVYNGDICTADDLFQLKNCFPEIKTVMIGRGILGNPGLAGECSGKPRINKNQLRAFHDQIYINYQDFLSGERNVLFRMKELWFYLNKLFTSSERYFKKIKKAETQSKYDQAVEALFAEQELNKIENENKTSD